MLTIPDSWIVDMQFAHVFFCEWMIQNPSQKRPALHKDQSSVPSVSRFFVLPVCEYVLEEPQRRKAMKLKLAHGRLMGFCMTSKDILGSIGQSTAVAKLPLGS